MEKSNFDELMERYLAGKVTPYERLKIEAWLEVMKTERTTDLEFTTADQERLFKKITGTDASVGDVIAMRPQRSRAKQIFSKQWVQIAASVTILLAVSFTVWNLVSDSAPLNLQGSSGKEKVILNDGSIVWMEQGSSLVYYEKEDGTRRARLTGEALFEVAKIPNSSFTVECGKIMVGVVGTSFTLKTGQEHIELKVFTGKVNLTSAEDTLGVNVLPNEKVIYTVKGEVQRIALKEEERTKAIAHTEYDMLFDNSSMRNVIERLEKKFEVKISVSDQNVNKCRVTANLSDHSIEDSLTIISDMLDITFTIHGKTVAISGKGCE